MKHKLAITVGLIAVAALAYGYWHVSSHGSLYVSVQDVSDRNNSRPVTDARLRFLDSTGNELARGGAEAPHGVVYITQPAPYACHDIEKRAAFSGEARDAWSRCFERQSRWLMTWVREARFVDLQAGSCRLPKIPVAASEYAEDWWLWWIPLPHIGGVPYSSFSLNIAVNLEQCAVDADDRGRKPPSAG